MSAWIGYSSSKTMPWTIAEGRQNIKMGAIPTPLDHRLILDS